MLNNYSITKDGSFEFKSKLYTSRYCNDIDCKCKAKKFGIKDNFFNNQYKEDHYEIVNKIYGNDQNLVKKFEPPNKQTFCVKNCQKQNINSFERFFSLFS